MTFFLKLNRSHKTLFRNNIGNNNINSQNSIVIEYYKKSFKNIVRYSSKMTTSTKLPEGLSAETAWDPESNIPQSVLLYLDTKLQNESKPTKYQQLNFFFQLVSLLKQQRRTGWINMGLKDPESISDHMYRMSIMTLVLDPKAWSDKERIPDLNKCSRIALVHDIAESLVGDIVPHDQNVDKIEKSKREFKAILYLCDVISKYCTDSANEIKELWIDYECQRNLEATIVKDIDKFELLMQTFEYERIYSKRMDEFYSCIKVIKNDEIKKLANELMEQRVIFLKENNL